MAGAGKVASETVAAAMILASTRNQVNVRGFHEGYDAVAGLQGHFFASLPGFLSHLCEKAGLPANMWQSPSVSISSFQAQVFCEERPGGKVSAKKLIR